jgi:hypothetical protein
MALCLYPFMYTTQYTAEKYLYVLCIIEINFTFVVYYVRPPTTLRRLCTSEMNMITQAVINFVWTSNDPTVTTFLCSRMFLIMNYL